MFPDYHCHTNLCGHASGEMEEYISSARLKGLPELGFSDHLPMYWLPEKERNPGLAMSEKELPFYVAKVIKLREENSDLSIKLGIEADYIPCKKIALSRLLNSHPFDYVLGSVHFVNGWAVDNPANKNEYEHLNLDEIYTAYFSCLQSAARSGLFNIMAHPDLIKKFGYRPKKDLTYLYEQTAVIFAKANVCAEVNTAGIRYPAREIYPSLELLRLFNKYGVSATVGSDAHHPEQVGEDWKEAAFYLKEAGYREIAAFSGRRPTMVKI